MKEQEAMQQAAVDLDNAARPFWCDGRYGAMRAVEYGEKLPPSVQRAFDAYHKACMAWGKARGF